MGMAAASSQFCFFFTLMSVLTISSYSGANEAVLLPTHQIRVLVWDFRVLSSVTGSGVPVDLYLNESLVENLVRSEDTSVISWLETHVVTFLPHVDIKTIILGSSGINDGVKSTGGNISSAIRYRLEKFHYAMEKINLERRIRLSVAFPLPLLEKMKTTSQERDFHGILDFIKKTDSSVVVESGIESLKSVQSLVEKSEFADIEIRKVSFPEDSKQGNLPSSGRKLLYDLKTTLHDTTVFPTDPNSPTTPTIVTVPSTNPITVAPTNPTTPTTPIPIPESTPVNMPPPANPPPVTVPGAQPVTNPVTTYPPPAGGNVPGVNPQAPPTPPSPGGNVPGVNPQAPPTPPSNNNAPAGGGGGGSWCVAKPGASQTALQSALDYACGGGADCSMIQQSGSCYNPNTLQNHASYAFNSYYQKNPAPTSCDFGGAATLVHNNPSTGSCVFPSSSSSSPTTPTTPTTPASPTATPTTPTPPTKQTPPTNPTTTPTTPMTPTTNPITSPGPGGSGSVTPPTVLNSSDPSSVFGTGMPPSVSTSTSRSSNLEPFVGFITLVTSVLAGMIILNM